MEITTVPACRVGWEGQTLHYVVKAEGAAGVMAPDEGIDGLEFRVGETRQVGDGVEAQLDVRLLNSKLY